MEAEEADSGDSGDSGDSNPAVEEQNEAKADEDALLGEEEDNSSMVVSADRGNKTLMAWMMVELIFFSKRRF